MKLKDVGEFGFIDRIKVDALSRLEEDLVGIGDDCALFQVSQGRSILLTTDMLVERVHFLLDKMTPFQLGYKALAVNLSDIAASGGIAREAFISIAVPEKIEVADLEDIYRGMKALAVKYDVNITGGDTTGSFTDLVINIAVTGEIEKEQALYRNGARAGDLICVTGNLGDSAAGLDILLNHPELKAEFESLVNQHLTPEPHLKQGRLIAKSNLASSMMDISDGLASDIRHICKASEVGAEIEIEQLPLSRDYQKYAREHLNDPLKTALGVGEDYCLLVTLKRLNYDALSREMSANGYVLHAVGKITDSREITLKHPDGHTEQLQWGGWDHFKEKDV